MFIPEELAAMRAADEEIEATFRLTKEEREAARRRDLSARLDELDKKSQKIARQKREYYEAHREEIARQKREYYEAHREEERQRHQKYREAHREKERQRHREYRQRKKAERRQKDEKEAS